MIQIKFNPGLLHLIMEKLDAHPIHKELHFGNHTERVKTVLKTFVMGDYWINTKDELERKIQDVVIKMRQ